MSSALQRSGTRRTTVTGLVAAIIAAVCLALVPATHAAKGMEVSLQDEGLFVTGTTMFEKPKAYSLLKGLQVTRLRFNAEWDSLSTQRCQRSKPSTPTYDFRALDQAIDSARAQGLNILLTVTGPAPAWANSKKSCTTNRDYQPNAKEFGKFAKIVGKRYASRVDQWSIWNEPNRKGWLQPVKTQGTQYQKLYLAGYKAIKSVDKDPVFIGELAPYASKPSVAQEPLAFLRQLTCTDRNYKLVRGKKCPKLTADGFAHHPYDFARTPSQRFPNRDAVTIANLSSLTSALDKLRRNGRLVPRRGSRLYLYLTEYGYFGSKEPGGKAKVFPESTRAKYLVQGFKKAQANSRVKQMLQYLLVRYPGAGTSRQLFDFDTSLVKQDATKLKAYSALASWAKSAAAKGQIKRAP